MTPIVITLLVCLALSLAANAAWWLVYQGFLAELRSSESDSAIRAILRDASALRGRWIYVDERGDAKLFLPHQVMHELLKKR